MSIRERIIHTIGRSKENLVIFTASFIIIAMFVVAALLQQRGMFTVTTPRMDMIKMGIVLSDTADFYRPRHELRSEPVIDMWNITETDLPKNIDNIDGEHNGADYLAYTFYVKNIGKEAINYTATATIDEMFKKIDAAMRVKVYYNGTPTLYAKPRSDGSGKPEPGTFPFVSNTVMFNTDVHRLDVNQVDKYTLVMWLEGEDPECVNDVLGGMIRMSMQFNASPIKDVTGEGEGGDGNIIEYNKDKPGPTAIPQ